MPGIEDLMQLAQGGGAPAPGGGGAPTMPGSPQPGGGGMPGAMIQKLQELMQNPIARQGMQQFAQQAGLNLPGLGGGGAPGQDPRAMLAGPQGSATMQGGRNPGVLSDPQSLAGAAMGRGGPATDADLYAVQEANQGVRGNLPVIPDEGGYTGYGEEMERRPDPRQMIPGREQDMVSAEIDRKGATFDGVDAPTAQDIERLKESPTDSMVEAFDAQFGEGATAKILGDAQEDDRGPSTPPYDEADEE